MDHEASVRIAESVLHFSLVYAALGTIFAVWFAAVGASRLNPQARAGTLRFRLLILPGAAALWPLLLAMVLSRRAARSEAAP